MKEEFVRYTDADNNLVTGLAFEVVFNGAVSFVIRLDSGQYVTMPIVKCTKYRPPISTTKIDGLA